MKNSTQKQSISFNRSILEKALEAAIAHVDESGAIQLLGSYPIRILAPVAAQLLQNDDYPTAAYRAARLIGACERQNAQLENLKILDVIGKKADLEEVVEFEKAIKKITGQNRIDRAFPDFRRFLSVCYPELDVGKKIEELRNTGIPGKTLNEWIGGFRLHCDYNNLKKTTKRGKKR